MEALPLSAPTFSAAVFRLYDDACGAGQVRISSADGEVLERRKLPPAVKSWEQFRGHVRAATYIKMRNPPSTYLIIQQHEATSARLPTMSCMVMSRSISIQDARAALKADAGSAQVRNPYSHASNPPVWKIDVPERGFRKELRVIQPDWVLLETVTYRPR